MNKHGYTAVELIIVIAIFTVAYFTTAVVISKDFNVNYEESMYNQKIAAIEKQATLYAENKEELFEDSNSVYMTVEELALANVIINNEDGVVTDPRDTDKNLNDLKVKITNENDKVTAKVLG